MTYQILNLLEELKGHFVTVWTANKELSGFIDHVGKYFVVIVHQYDFKKYKWLIPLSNVCAIEIVNYQETNKKKVD